MNKNMNEQVYTNYRLQLPDQELLGTLVVREGRIAEIQPGISALGQDGQGHYLMPGLIELHTDNLEKCVSPRPKVEWPMTSAVMNHDRQIVSAGITTVYDAIAVGDISTGSIRFTHAQSMIDGIAQAQQAGRFAADHKLHLRCELSCADVVSITEAYIDHPLLSLISLMDHTPGQRQFVKVEKFKDYYMGKHGVSATEVEVFIQQRQEEQRKHGDRNRLALVKMAQAKNISIASHDDATIEHVQEAIADGASIAEFPTTLEAAHFSHQQGLQVLMGAPNIVLGGSHSGNIAAMELVQRDWLDILSSDYAPQSLLHAVFLIAQKTENPLYKTMQIVTSNPAKACNLDQDRGSLTVGKRADLITVYDDGIMPQLSSVICGGQRVA